MKMATTKTTKSTKAPAKKTAPRRKTPTKSVITEEPEVTLETSEDRTENKGGMKLKKSYLIAGLAVLLLAGLLYAFRSLFIVAMVNGQPISRVAFIQELERTAGKQTMNAVVTKTLISQEARKQNVNVSDDEVNKEIKKIEDNLKQQGQRLDQVLTLQGMTKDQLVEQIRIQKMIEKMVGKNVKISDQEVAAYVEANRESLPQGQDENALRSGAKERLQQQKLNEEVQKWLENLQKNAKIDYFMSV